MHYYVGANTPYRYIIAKLEHTSSTHYDTIPRTTSPPRTTSAVLRGYVTWRFFQEN